MVSLPKARLVLAVLAGLGFGMVSQAKADVILSPALGGLPEGAFQVGITPLGRLFDANAPAGGNRVGVGFLRTVDNYDPIFPGTAIEGWGVSAGAVAGFVHVPSLFGVSPTIVAGTAMFSANMAVTNSILRSGTTDLLSIQQTFTFDAANVLKIATKITNVSNAAQDVRFRRVVDWDLHPLTLFDEFINSPALPAGFTAGHDSIADPNPLIGFGSPIGAGGGTFGPGDNGAGIDFLVGNLVPGASRTLNVFHAISQANQSEASLRAQVEGVSGGFVITGVSADPSGSNSAALGIRALPIEPPEPPPNLIPEPSSITLVSIGLLGLLGYGWRRRERSL
jgi:hypothetical protein